MLTQKPFLKFLALKNTSILDQLHLEEYLLRDTTHNICLINYGSPPAIVMGISGKVEELIHIDEAKNLNIPIIKRFSGGGTVAIDENTLFVTFIFNSKDVSVPCFPEHIYKFSEGIYQRVFANLPFELKQNDYVLGDKKFGGNAQYIKKDRWLHHTSFLWDYRLELMQTLKHPKKTPTYRQERTHQEFITKLFPYYTTIEEPILKIKQALQVDFELVEDIITLNLKQCSRLSTHIIEA